ncbi:hypothetical protein QFC22_003433 [Naganishia vaughanmartiniae]|uniref:Uncharacterized protein n=1 Tax=Naganishia vaughanmartiniae TaxID=1424756 RepID=A0ACC2X6S2_9TREE|nr:hypothetical protein QFC22_003433 [Naganishia vaughanmartiniae]
MNNPSMMWGMGNPYAAQAMMAANMAYQNSMMMAMSTAGSQYGGATPGVGAGEQRATSPMLPPPQMMMPPPMMSPGMGYPGFNSPMMPPWGGMMMPPPPSTLNMPPTGGRNAGDGAVGGQGNGGK